MPRFDAAAWAVRAIGFGIAIPGRTRGQFAADVYGTNQANEKPVQTIAAWVGLVTRKGIPEEVIYEMTRTFWEHIDEMHAVAPWAADAINLGNAFEQMNMKLHPGALRYYEEAGVKVPESVM